MQNNDIQEMQPIKQNLSIIEGVDINEVQNTMQKIRQFQKVIQNTLNPNYDYGVVPGTNKPTLLKPGAEKILMLMGLRSEFEVLESTRNFEDGFFQYQVKCKLYKDEVLITEGLGACNTKETKYIKLDPFTLDNTVLKMAKKRALIDATLLVASLSEVFTQDLEDIELETSIEEGNREFRTKASDTITKKQAKRMFALADGNLELVKKIMIKYGYTASEDVKRNDYEKICSEIEQGTGKGKSEVKDLN
jgi:hypothetical protein